MANDGKQMQAAAKNAGVDSPRLNSLLNEPAIRKRFEDMLGKRASSFLSSVLSAVAANPQLRNCEPMSVISSAAIAAALDLPINASLGQAHIVPYNGVAQFQIGWKGLVQLALRSNQYQRIHATTVLEGQIKKVNSFTGDYEFQEEAKSNKVVGYVLYFRLLNGYEKICYMSREQCEAHAKEYSKAYQKGFGPWKDDFDSMALKTVVKLGLNKWGPLSVEMQKAIVSDQGTVTEIGAESEPLYLDAPEKPSEEAPAAPQSSSRVEKLVGANRKSEPKDEPTDEQIAIKPPRAHQSENMGRMIDVEVVS